MKLLCVCVYIYLYNFIYIYTSERIKEDASILCYPEFGANHDLSNNPPYFHP